MAIICMQYQTRQMLTKCTKLYTRRKLPAQKYYMVTTAIVVNHMLTESSD